MDSSIRAGIFAFTVVTGPRFRTSTVLAVSCTGECNFFKEWFAWIFLNRACWGCLFTLLHLIINIDWCLILGLTNGSNNPCPRFRTYKELLQLVRRIDEEGNEVSVGDMIELEYQLNHALMHTRSTKVFFIYSTFPLGRKGNLQRKKQLKMQIFEKATINLIMPWMRAFPSGNLSALVFIFSVGEWAFNESRT
ncbi:hypothetical protein L2E82_38739 [Cichorium intybus]|uniref:Uncharacterized protein n=1 Tax=Cichorium intybus TaxID=13427 RepID=A0ACB9AHP8_CICIN|nr:hypothetical protein L2E82_38739 [Cichorium intybus]